MKTNTARLLAPAFGLVSGLALSLLALAGLTTIAQADTIVSMTETHYDSDLRPDCVAVRMNPVTFADAASSACALKTAGSQGNDRITKTVYDAAGQVTQVIQAYGTSNQRVYSTFSYSDNGKVVDMIDANGNRSHNVYDGFDHLSAYYYPSTTRPTAFNASTQATALSTAGAYNVSDYEAFTYDNNGNRLTTRRRDGQILTDCYDALNRQIVHYVHSQSGCTATGGAKDVYTTYDLQGHILTKRFASTSGTGVSYAYNGIGQVTSSTDMFNRTVSYQYNQAGARTRLTDNEGYYVAYALDNLNRLTQATLNGTTNVLYGQTFNSLGQRTLLSRGASSAGGSTTYAYDNLNRLQGIAIDTAGTSYDVTWGKVGAVGSVAYNPAGQITNWASSNTIFDYAEIAGTTDARTYDGLNRDAGVAALTGGYDARGNLTTDGTRTFTYDVENRLLTSTGGTNPLTLVYDPEGRLARVTSGSTTKDFLYDGVDLIAEYNSNGTVAARYIHGPGTDDPLVWLQGADDSDRRYYYTNYQGSLIGYTGSTGSFVTSSLTKYGAYGEPRNSTNTESWPASRFGYTGQVVLADAKLYYYKARVYDPVFGRFLQTDPVGSKDDLDLYAYTGGDPVNKSDPTGLQNCSCIGVTTEIDGQPVARTDIPIRDVIHIGAAAIGASGVLAVAELNSLIHGKSDTKAVTQTDSAEERSPNYVYRALAKGENPAVGLVARNPSSTATPAQHLNGKIDSPWISSSKSLAVATGKYGDGGAGIVQIDLNKVPSPIVDASNGLPGASQKVNNFARADQEVLIYGYVPPTAITSYQTFGH